ncbi:MAG TPA: SDR family NAD(P)-dependent oxidoreductase [Anaerolineales bacterium]|nr:SDR family NAD(P)-dependent oxidoreductase [Anaerolineales bacterium]
MSFYVRSIYSDLSAEERQKLLALRSDAEGAASQIIAEGGQAIPFYGDVADYDTAGRLVQTALEAYGQVDILVNNAAGLGTGMVMHLSEKEWDYQTVPKLKGAFNTMNHAVPHMIKQQFGRVINIASDAWIGMNGMSAYSAANAGLVGWTKASAKDLFKLGITVNAVCPQAASPV